MPEVRAGFLRPPFERRVERIAIRGTRSHSRIEGPRGPPNPSVGQACVRSFSAPHPSGTLRSVAPNSPAPPAGAPATVNARETIRLETSLPFAVTSNDPERSSPITEFLLSSQALDGLSSQGDPAMLSLPASAQHQEDDVFLVPDGDASNDVTVIHQQGGAERDGVLVDAARWPPLGVLDGVGYESVHLGVETGSHSISSDQPCGIVSVGYDQDVSYANPGRSGLEVTSEPPPPPVG
ncbi:MAG: hypothetical protein ACRBN8_06850 [Nannocystales bacterium]